MELHLFLHISIKSLIDLNRSVNLFVIKVRLIEMPFELLRAILLSILLLLASISEVMFSISFSLVEYIFDPCSLVLVSIWSWCH